MRGPDAPVTPRVLRWARETAGLDLDTAASRVPVSADKLAGAESGTETLTLNQARKLADVYERPFALLFLPAPPEEAGIEVQFRRLRDAPSPPWPPAMRALARRIPTLQDEAVDVMALLEEEPRWPDVFHAFASYSLDEAITHTRGAIGVSLLQQKQAASTDPQGYRAFRVWREAIEDLGVLVVQDGTLPVSDMRGFVAPHPRVPAIVINTQDNVRARLFTLLHELVHLVRPQTAEQESERFAAAVLMPGKEFGADFRRSEARTLLGKVDALARSYSVTSDAAAVRVGWLELAAWPAVDAVRDEIRARAAPAGASGGNHYRNVVTRYGPGFVGRVLGALDQGAMSDLAAARILGVRVDRFPQLRSELEGGVGA